MKKPNPVAVGTKSEKRSSLDRGSVWYTDADLLGYAGVEETIELCRRHLPPDTDPIHFRRLDAEPPEHDDDLRRGTGGVRGGLKSLCRHAPRQLLLGVLRA